MTDPRPPTLSRRRDGVRLADLRGAVGLAVEGVHGVTRIAQALHGSITGLAMPVGRRRERPAGGIAGLVYGSVRLGSTAVGRGLDAALRAAEALQGASGDDDADLAGTGRREAIVSALNGIVGHQLARTGNPLAIAMRLTPVGAPSPHLLLLVHGLCMNDRQWRQAGHDHGAALAGTLGCTPVHVLYNSGRHVAVNGAELAERLEALVAAWPVPVQAITLLGHSMGGLVARSAAHRAQAAGMAWPGQLRHLVFLGTPHHGAPLERAGNWLHGALGVSPYAAPFARLSGLRSDGITDLRHGHLQARDAERGRFDHGDHRSVVPLPAGVACFAVAGTTAVRARGRKGAWPGDGLVSVDSALGRHPHRRHDLRIPAGRRWLATGVNHFGLLGSTAVFERLRQWLQADARAADGTGKGPAAQR